MRSLKNAAAVTAIAMFAATGSLIATAQPAAARIACNAEGDCWHTDKTYHYDRGVKVVVHPDSWYFHQSWDKDHRYHEHHDDRGYYRNGAWVHF